ncbi:OLC1v1025815C1 [Oldenlandia corymbosa var. corymbosa]|uniref:OLC1v1025815C1 n=1 Tax=Oldenlandia corymbosa var. corymbosa TaxID=529605 RepID=A0AAV1C8G8_OLDCO|nr:OLC1v1025815C1 [Oldenlandia corymbosa var. corymbosa]
MEITTTNDSEHQLKTTKSKQQQLNNKGDLRRAAPTMKKRTGREPNTQQADGRETDDRNDTGKETTIVTRADDEQQLQ